MNYGFDTLSKALATGFNRRDAMKWLGGGIVGSVAARWTGIGGAAMGPVMGAAVAAPKDKPPKDQGKSDCERFCTGLPPHTRSQCLLACKQCGGTGNLCGAVGHICCCGAGSFCCGMTCCPNTNQCCNDVCTDTMTDSQNCGTCGVSCSPGTYCVNGTCQALCPPTFAVCNGTCTDILFDTSNCGACNNVCPTYTHGVTTCVSGTCEVVCTAGYATCDSANPCGTNTLFDSNNCGGCGVICPAGTICQGGVCVSSCPPYSTYCSGTCVDLLTDTNNCGSCGHVCPVVGYPCNPHTCNCHCCGFLCLGTCCDTCYDTCGRQTVCINGICQ